jgi:tetratricopeptide (TPR) repeat protein
MRTGLDLFEKEKYGAAQHYFEKAAQHSDKNSLVRTDAEYYAALCAVELFNKDAEDLLIAFIHAHPESPHVRMACYNLGRYKYRKKQYGEAIEWFKKVDVSELDQEETHEFLFKRGYSYFEKEEYDLAEKDLYEVKDIDNKYAAPASFYYAHIQLRKKNYETALKEYKKLTANESFAAIVPYYIAEIMYLQGKYEEVITYAGPLVEDTVYTGRTPLITKIMAESNYRTGRYSEAQAWLEKYRSYVPQLSRYDWYELGYTYYKTGDSVKALNAFKNSTNGEDSLAQNAFYHMGSCYLKNKSKQMALDAFYHAYKIDANAGIREDALFNYAKLSYELSYNPFSEAIRAFEEYLKAYPNSPRSDEAYTFLVGVYFTTKNYEAALASMEKIKTLTPDLKAAYQKIAYYRGVQLFNDENLDDAIRYFDRSLQYPIDHNYNCLAKYWKGDAYYRRGENGHKTEDLESAIKYYKEFLFEPGAVNQAMYNTVNYSLGYAYFKEKKYADANTWFRKFTGSKTQEPPEKLNDANLRIADGFFVLKDYSNASDYYDKVLELKLNDVDYALFQKAMVLGLLGKYDAKAKILERLLAEFAGKTSHEAAAEYELAKTSELNGDNDKAYTYYSKILTDHPNSIFVANTMLQIGNLQNKKGRYDEALSILNDVLNKYPKTDVAREAVNIMREVCKKKGDSDCLDKLKNLGMGNISMAGLDSDNYVIAKNYYLDGKYDEAYKAFSKYQQKFADGSFIIDAYYYKGEIDYKGSNLTSALGEYNFVLDRPYNKYTSNALAKASWINYKLNNYEQALAQYVQLEKVSEYPNEVLDAKVGQMRCNYFLLKYDEAIAGANSVLAVPKLSNELTVEAQMTIGRSALKKADYDMASKAFNKVMTLTQNERSAEAKYSIALIQYSKGEYKASQKTIFELINGKPSYGFWVGKAFLLLSDNYIAVGDHYNAKYTLKTLIEKSTNPELVEEAKTKLANILETEKTEEENNQKKTSPTDEIRLNNPKDSLLFNEKGGGQ